MVIRLDNFHKDGLSDKVNSGLNRVKRAFRKADRFKHTIGKKKNREVCVSSTE